MVCVETALVRLGSSDYTTIGGPVEDVIAVQVSRCVSDEGTSFIEGDNVRILLGKNVLRHQPERDAKERRRLI